MLPVVIIKYDACERVPATSLSIFPHFRVNLMLPGLDAFPYS